MKPQGLALLLSRDSLRSLLLGGGLANRFRENSRSRADLRRLRALDDHMLADIGLRRDMVSMDVIRHGRRN